MSQVARWSARFVRLTSVAVGSAALVIAAVPTIARADCIRTVVSGSASNSFEHEALRIALIQWHINAKQSAGDKYSDWGKAQDKGQSCIQSANKKYYTCTVRAVPCS